MKKITQQNWDVILDFCGYYPNSLDTMLDALKGKVGRYIYVSTSSHLDIDDNNTQALSEDTPLIACSKEERDDPNVGTTYNQKKAECERVIQSKDWLEKIIIRPGLITGQYDYTDRMYYWFYKMHTQKNILIPAEARELSSYSDAHDLAKMMAQAIEVKNNYDTYNAASYNTSIRSFLDNIKAFTNNETTYISASPEFLEKHEVAPWFGLPLWITNNAFQIDNARIVEDFQFTCSTVEDTTRQLLDYYGNSLKWRKAESHGSISDEKEQELIELLTKQ